MPTDAAGPSALVRLLLQATAGLHARSAFAGTLVPTVGLAFALQAAVAVPSIALQSERFYDASGSVTYLSCTALSLALPALRAKYGVRGDGAGVLSSAASAAGSASSPRWQGIADALRAALRAQPNAIWHWRMLALSAAAGIWATRLGSFLFARILSEGQDSRFAKIRSSPPKFAAAFAAQATWVSLVLLPVLAVNSLPAATVAAAGRVGAFDVLGGALWAGGFALDEPADRQKSRWAAHRAAKRHSEQFLTSGLWGRSRHPNYFGEATLWTGAAVAAAGTLATGPARAAMGLGAGAAGVLAAIAMAAASPAFTTFLLLQVSGVPMSEKKYDRRFAGNKDYEKWKRETPKFFPKLW